MNLTGDERITALYKAAFPQVARVLHRLGADPDTAKDLFHDALIIYLEKSSNGTLQLQQPVNAYLVGIARLLWYKKFRQDHRYTTLAPDSDIPDDFYDTPEPRARSVWQYLQRSGQKCLELLQAFYYDQLNMQQIAETFHYRSTHSATVQKYKCLEKVRNMVRKTASYASTTE